MIHLAIINISSWVGYDPEAEHIYGNLILSEHENVTIDNVDENAVKYLGEKIELEQPLTKEIAKALDEKNEEDVYHHQYLRRYSTNRFETDERIIEIAKQKYEELQLDCPMINLFEGEKYNGTKIFYN